MSRNETIFTVDAALSGPVMIAAADSLLECQMALKACYFSLLLVFAGVSAQAAGPSGLTAEDAMEYGDLARKNQLSTFGACPT